MNRENSGREVTHDYETLPRSLWADTAEPLSFPLESLQGKISADVIVIGGGFTGLSCALSLAENDCNVVLLEANDIGFGGSGRNVGLVNAGLWMAPDTINETIGSDFGNRLYQALSEAPTTVFKLISDLNINCEAVRNGTLHLARGALGIRQLEARFQQLISRHEPVEWLNADATADAFGSAYYQHAILDHRAGTIQPLSYVRGIANAVVENGGCIYQRSAVLAMEKTSANHQSAQWRVTTETGEVVAPRVVLATNAYSGDAMSSISHSYTPVEYFQMATAPLTKEQLSIILPHRQGCWDTGLVMTSVRLDGRGRLILGSVGKVTNGAVGQHLIHWANRIISNMFPQLPQQEWQFKWSGRIAYSADHLPHFHEIEPGLVTVMGYSGRGIGPGTVMGKWLAKSILKEDFSLVPLPMTQPEDVSFRKIKQSYYRFGSDMYHIYKSL